MSMPQIVILAGGLGSRIRSLYHNIPKSLVPVNGQPFVHHQLTWLKSEGIDEVVMCIGHLGEQIELFVGNGSRYGMDIKYSYDGGNLIGTGGAVKKALPLLRDEFFTIYGDTYLDIPFAKVFSRFYLSKKNGLMSVYKNELANHPCNVEFNGHKIVNYSKREKPKMHHMDYGLSIFRKEVFDKIDLEVFDLTVAYEQLIAQDQLAHFLAEHRFYEIGTPWGLADTEAYLRSKNELHRNIS